jgi:hypothetical protein
VDPSLVTTRQYSIVQEFRRLSCLRRLAYAKLLRLLTGSKAGIPSCSTFRRRRNPYCSKERRVRRHPHCSGRRDRLRWKSVRRGPSVEPAVRAACPGRVVPMPRERSVFDSDSLRQQKRPARVAGLVGKRDRGLCSNWAVSVPCKAKTSPPGVVLTSSNTSNARFRLPQHCQRSPRLRVRRDDDAAARFERLCVTLERPYRVAQIVKRHVEDDDIERRTRTRRRRPESLRQAGNCRFSHGTYGRGMSSPRTSLSPCQLAQRTFSHCAMLMR